MSTALAAGPRNRIAAVVAIVGAGLAASGTFLTWYRIEIGGVAAPGGSATGWQAADGRTVTAGAVLAALAAVAIVLGRSRLPVKVTLLVAGAVTAIVAFAGIVDTSSKADNVEDEFAIPAGRVAAEVGAGLLVVAVGGLGELAGGVLARVDDEETAEDVTPTG